MTRSLPEFIVALENLGFQSYLADVKEYVDEAKEVALKKRRQSTKLQNLGIPEEELLRQQQELFAKVRFFRNQWMLVDFI